MIVDKELEDIKVFEDKLKTIKDCLKLDTLKEELENLKSLQASNDFWQDLEKATEINKKVKHKQGIIDNFNKLADDVEYVKELVEIVAESVDEQDMYEELVSSIKQLDKEVESNYLNTLLQGKYDECDAILTLHAGAGGTESQDWASMLLRMYTRYAERNKFSIKVLDYQAGDEAGIKSASILISGDNAYGYLKAETGVHRLVRISPFDSNARRHTSFCSCEVVPMIETTTDIVINPDELRIDTYRSSGAGGQHVNKTDSAVRITHIPTGIVTQCQNERSQIQNREVAMKMLIGKLAEIQEKEEKEKINKLKGDVKKIEWGSQIRSYVFCPYTMVKDHRTDWETSDIQSFMDGDMQECIEDYLKKSV